MCWCCANKGKCSSGKKQSSCGFELLDHRKEASALKHHLPGSATEPESLLICAQPTGWLRPSPIHGAFSRVLPLPVVFSALPLADDPAPRPAAAAAGAAGERADRQSLPDELDLSVVQARTLCWLALLAEAHEEQASEAPPAPPIGKSQSGLGFWWGSKVCPPVHPPLREVAVR